MIRYVVYVFLCALLCLLSQQAEAVSASGGVVTNYAENGTNFVAHIFTNTASSTSITFTVGGSVEVLIVAGGGAGGKASASSGGGGAGGLIYSNLSVLASNYTIIVGSGAVGRTTSGTGASGNNSSFGVVSATGGGGGGGSTSAGGNGGSGGGAQITYGTGIAGQGKDGGSGTGSYIGGGGGAGSKGTNGVTGAAGHGGLGLAYSLSGVSLFYAGGGGGCYSSGTSGNGGSGVGGNGGATPGNGMNGRGGGGGGGGSSTSGNGGSGVVIVRYVSGGASTNIISYDANGATSGTVPTSQIKTQDVMLVLASNVGNLARTGYTFSGWNTDSTGAGTTYAEGANYAVNADAVLYAYWITNAPPSITVHPTNITVSSGQTATFNVTATGSPTLVYQWYTNDVAISGAVGTNYTTPATSTNDSGKQFKVVVTNAYGAVTSSVATLTVNDVPTTNVPPSITMHPTNITVSSGQTATFGVTAAGSPTLVYQWYTNDVEISGAVGANYTTPATSTSDSGKQFKVVVTNAYGAVTSTVATLTVNAAPAGGVVATGGTITNYTLNGTNYTAHIFTTNGTFAVSTGGEVEYLIVAGGGAGGKASTSSGGGGAGGLIYSNAQSVSAIDYTVVIGAGGIGRTTSGTGTNGGNSSFGAVTATGGGGGGGSTSAGGNGGSGGGAQTTYGTGIVGQGKDGGSGTGNYIGGGGGAGSKGTNGVTGAAGHGGLGLAYDLSGELLFYAGGGGGCYGSGTSGNGGSGVGGNGGSTPGNGMNGRGGGGGGGGTTTSGNGGSGIVIVRYKSGDVSTNTYTISYSTNEATSGTVPASQTKTQDVTLVLASNVGNLARSGYTFSGWNTDSNGTGTTYAEGANYTANTGAVLYAYWITNAPPTITTHPTNSTVSVGQTATFNVIVTGTPALVYQWYTNDVAISGATGTNYTTPVTTLSDSGKVYKVVVTNIFGTATSSNAILSVLATNNVPYKPIIVSPTNQTTGVSTSPSLTVEVSDPDGGTNLSVVFYGREYSRGTPTDFTIVHIADSQMYYMQDNMTHIGQSITDWVVSNRASSNIVAVYQVGDVVQNASDAEFVRSTNTYYRLSNTALTGSPSLPWTIIGAAHDTEAATRGIFPTWNKYYGTNYFADKPYWGGCYNGSNEHNYILFSAGGLDFIILGLSQYADENPGALTWATNVLKTYSNRRALVVTHSLLYETTRPTPSTYSAGGPGIWTAMKTCSNVFMITGGHNTGHGWRDETNNFGQIVPLLTADYQGLADGGSGYFRLMRFHPSTGVVDFWTYSAYKTNVMTDDILVDSKFSITNSMLRVSSEGPTNAFVCLGTNTAVSSGQQTSKVWSGLSAGSTYQWYAEVNDGMYKSVSDEVMFTVAPQTARTFQFFRVNTAVRVGGSVIHVQGEIK